MVTIRKLFEFAAPGLDFTLRIEQPGELADVAGFRLIVQTPVEPAAGKAGGRRNDIAAPSSLLCLGGERMLAVGNLAAAVPAKLADDHWLAASGHLGHHALKISQIFPLLHRVPVIVMAGRQRIEMNREKIEV